MYIGTTFCLSIHLSISGHLGCSRTVAFVNNATMNVGVQISLLDNDFISSGPITRSGMAASQGSAIVHFLRNLHTGFRGGCTNLRAHQQHARLIFVYWHCILWLLLTSFTNSKRFLVQSLRFSMYEITLSANGDNLTSSFMTWIPFISFSWLTVLPRTSVLRWIKVAEGGLSCSLS